MRYLITVSYDGSKFNGFQRLKNDDSVQKELENALSIINKSDVLVKGSGRTDRGVHALGQKCHFNLDVYVPEERIVNAINSLVSKYIRVVDAKIVEDSFHARFSVKKKTYKYIINLGEYDLFKDDYVYNYNKELDVDSMKKAARYLIGKHNFKAFVSGYRDNYNSEIFSIDFSISNNYLTIYFVGKSFYRYMVRNLVGVLILVGSGKIKPEYIEVMLNNVDGNYSYITVPPNGLYLERVDYDE